MYKSQAHENHSSIPNEAHWVSLMGLNGIIYKRENNNIQLRIFAMASSNPKTFQDTNSHAAQKNSKCEDPTVPGKKDVNQPKEEDEVRDGRSKHENTKVDDALKFLVSVFEEGEPSQTNKGISFKFSTTCILNKIMFSNEYIKSIYF